MFKAAQIAPDVYWVGALDWNEREFHGYDTEAGITYNAYLVLDEKVTLIDTVKASFASEMLERIASVVDPASIDVVIANHVEPDHSGALPAVRAVAPNAQIYASAPKGVAGLAGYYGDLGVTGVKSGETLSIGARELAFVHTPFVHWPDNMVTYDAADKILFSNDAFGQHYATSARFDDEPGVDAHEALYQARKYYANIVMPYGKQAAKAVAAVRGLGEGAVELIAPSHGVIWRSHVEDVLKLYEDVLTSGAVAEKAVVVYQSMHGSTDKLAHALTDGFTEAGVPVQLMDLRSTHLSDVLTAFLDAKYLCVGSPSLNNQMMPQVAAFMNYLRGFSPKNDQRVGLAFGSYGWSPKGVESVAAKLEAASFAMPGETIAVQWAPGEEQLDAAREAAKSLVA